MCFFIDGKSLVLARSRDFDTTAHETSTSSTNLSKVNTCAHFLRNLECMTAVATEVTQAKVGLLFGKNYLVRLLLLLHLHLLLES